MKFLVHKFRQSLGLILTLLSLAWVQFAAQANLDSEFDRLCQAHRQQDRATSRSELAAFCQRHATAPFASQGYFLLGYQEFENRRFLQAEEFLSKASRQNGPITDYVVYFRAASLSELKRFRETQEQLADFATRFQKSPFVEKSQILYWQCSLELKDAQSVLNSASRVTDLETNPEPLYYRAQALELLGDLAGAVANYQRLHYEFPLYGQASSVSASLTSLLKAHPELDVEIRKERRISRAEKLLAGKRYRDTLQELEALFQNNAAAAENLQFRLWEGISLFGSGQYYAAILALKKLSAAPAETAARACFTIAESYRKLDNYSQFKQAVEEMQPAFKSSSWWEEALFSIGNYNLVRRDLEESMSFYRRIVEHFPNGARARDCHWRVAWHQFRQGNTREALEMFVDHLTRYADSEHRLTAFYWAARCQQILGRSAHATQIFQALAQKVPSNHYGQLSAKNLGDNVGSRTADPVDARMEGLIDELILPARPNAVRNLSVVREASLNDWPRAKALARLHLFDLAARELLRPKVYPASPVVDFQAAKLFAQDESFFQATVYLRRVFPNYLDLPLSALPREVWEMFFPLAYRSTILQEAVKYQIDPFLVMALIRQESAFDPKAVSAANAHGLMQLLPSTARRLARSMKLPRPSTAHLHDPNLNIRLGMRYFADLLKQFDGNEEKVLASYNAGEHRVESWMSEGSYADSAEFVDTIPFSETRNYVKIIRRNYWFYKALYGNKH